MDAHLDRVPRLEGERAVSSQFRRNVDEELVIGSPPSPRWAIHELALSLEHHRAIPICAHNLGAHIPFRATHGFTIMVAQSLSSLCPNIGIPKGGRRYGFGSHRVVEAKPVPKDPGSAGEALSMAGEGNQSGRR